MARDKGKQVDHDQPVMMSRHLVLWVTDQLENLLDDELDLGDVQDMLDCSSDGRVAGVIQGDHADVTGVRLEIARLVAQHGRGRVVDWDTVVDEMAEDRPGH